MIFRLRTHKRLQLDDTFMMVACTFFIAGTTVYYETFHVMYRFQSTGLTTKTIEEFQAMSYAYLAATWLTIYSVKFSFLCFFRSLLSRLRTMLLYWRIVVSITSIACCFCFAEVFFACPESGLATRELFSNISILLVLN